MSGERVLLVGLGNPGSRICRHPPQHRLHGARRHRPARTASPWRRSRFQGRAARRGRVGEREGAAAEAADLHERERPVRSPPRRASTRFAPEEVVVFHDELDLVARQGPGEAGRRRRRAQRPARHRSALFGTPISGGCGSASAIPATRTGCMGHVLGNFAKADRHGSSRCWRRSPMPRRCW